MQLDKTQIAIRERALTEIYDLALIVMRRYWWRIVQAIAISAIPFSIMNAIILWPLKGDLAVNETAAMFIYLMTILVYLEAPLVGLTITLLLGDALFHDKPDFKRSISGMWPVLPRIFWIVFVLRGILPGMILAFIVTIEEEFFGFTFLIFLLGYAILLRTVRPYIGEILVLEKNPVFSGKKGIITVNKRSSSLHQPNFGDLIVRAMMSSVSILLTLSIVLNVFGLRGYVFGRWDWDPEFLFIWYPASMWLVVAYMSVVRFLSYLDLRIRREGWEVELVLRAEATRMREAVG